MQSIKRIGSREFLVIGKIMIPVDQITLIEMNNPDVGLRIHTSKHDLTISGSTLDEIWEFITQDRIGPKKKTPIDSQTTSLSENPGD